MGGEGHIAAMIASMKNNSRRKNKHTPFSRDNTIYKKGEPIEIKKLTPIESEILLLKLKEIRLKEDKQRIYKLIITLVLTIIVIGSIILIINIF
ncbi:MAG: hypothetical protein CO118_05135 [Flavobacteriales bacterium CG_4_9_14_3_um_filter_32_8]|nr:MAG: hypothetical protein CO118_05135 [Flavobacteriales bacterium CG_4_9_14_3_um_filter_32_8]